MVIKNFTVNLLEVKNDVSLRFDCKFFWLERTFSKFEEKNTLKIIKLKELKKEIISGSYVDTYVEEHLGIPYIRGSDIRPFVLDENKDNYKFVSKKVNKKIKTNEKELVIPRTSAKAEFLGKASFIDRSNESWATSQHVTKISIKEDIINPYYLLAFFNSAIFKYQMTISSQGITRVELTHAQLDKIRVIIPDKRIINSISLKMKSCIKRNRECISLIENSKSILQKELKRKKIRKQDNFSVNLSDMKKEFLWTPRYHNPELVEMEKVLKSYEGVRIKDIAEIGKGIEPGSGSYSFYLSKYVNDIPFIRTADICNNYIELLPDYFVDEEFLSDQLILKKKDILFTKDGKIGLTAMATEEDRAIICGGILKIRINKESWNNKKILPNYIFLALSVLECGGCQAKRRTVIGTTIPHLRKEYIENFHIPFIENKDMEKINKDIGKAFLLIEENKKDFHDVLTEINNLIKL